MRKYIDMLNETFIAPPVTNMPSKAPNRHAIDLPRPLAEPEGLAHQLMLLGAFDVSVDDHKVEFTLSRAVDSPENHTAILRVIKKHLGREQVNEATPVKPVQPVKPMKPSDPRHNQQNTTAPIQQQPQQQQQQPDTSHKLPNGQTQQPLPNGQQDQPLQANGQLQMGRNGKPLDPRDPAYDASLEIATDENGEPIDQQTQDGLNAGEEAQKYLKKQGVIESADLRENAEADRLEWERTRHVITGDRNGGSYQGNPMFFGLVDLHTGSISNLHTYEYAEDYDFELRSLLTGDALASLNEEESAVFYIGPNLDGSGPRDGIMIDFAFGGASGGPFLRRKLERMIRSQLD